MQKMACRVPRAGTGWWGWRSARGLSMRGAQRRERESDVEKNGMEEPDEEECRERSSRISMRRMNEFAPDPQFARLVEPLY